MLLKIAPLKMFVAALVLAMTGPSAHAADLPARSHIGEIFAAPAGKLPPGYRPRKRATDISLWTILPPRVPGNYGRPGDFEYSSYYGTRPGLIFGRLPYACGFVGTCAGTN